MMFKILRKYVGRILGATLFAIAASAWASDSEQREQCEAWLKDRYCGFSHVETIREYMRGDEYHYRANYYVEPCEVSPTTIGFDCTVYPDSGKVVGIANLEPYASESETDESVSSLQEMRMKYGGDGCPNLSAWKKLADEVAKGNYTAEISSSCIWIEEGDRVLGPIEREEYQGSQFVRISLPNGKRYWIEEGNL